ncbi:MAG: hypothetical protein HYV24_02725 [Deltaproteobacteria bacterium]|nr:hypothetical protein [Deltaproteobacteria bacterium]
MADRREKTRKLLRIAGHVLRGTLFFFALIGIIALWAWPSQKGLIDRLDGKIAAYYSGRYASRLDAASSLLASGKSAESKKEFEAIVTELSGVDKEEKLGHAYSRALGSLLSISKDEQGWKGALAYSRALVDFEPNDYGFWLDHAEALDKNGKREEAITAMQRAYAIAPQSLVVTKALSAALIDEKRGAEAVETARGYMDANRAAQVYAYYAGPGEGFSKSRVGSATAVITGKKQVFRVPIGSAGVERLRIDFRGLLDMELELSSISLMANGAQIELPIEGLELSTFGLEQRSAKRYDLTGKGDVRIGFTLPGGLRGAKITAVSVEAVFTPKLDGLSAPAGI